MTPSDRRRRRQLDELRSLCQGGAVGRAVDLAFEHFACFGPDDDIVVLLEAAAEHLHERDEVRRRLLELRAVRR